MSEWKKRVLGDLIEVKHGFAFKGDFFQTEPNGIVLTTPGNFKIGGGWKEDKCKFYNGVIPKEYVLKGGELVITMTDLSKEVDTLGYSAIIPINSDNTYLHNQRIGLIELINDESDKKFLYWLMRDKEYRWHVVSSASGSTVSHTSPARIKDYEFLLPPLPEQKAIASVLSSLENKIDLLYRQNKTLEAMAETLFRQWFVEEAREDWEEKSLKEICVINNGYAFKSTTYQEFGQKIIRTLNFSEHWLELDNLVYISPELAKSFEKYYLKRKDFLLVMVGANLGNFAICTKDVLPALQNQNMWCFRAKGEMSQHYLNFALRKLVYENLHGASGSARQFFQKNVFYNLEITVPPLNMVERFDEIVEGYFQKIELNKLQVQTLEKLRDTLLPKLMSGEVRVEYEN